MTKNKRYTGPYIPRKRVNKGISDEDKERIQNQPPERLKFRIGMTSTEYLAVRRDIIAWTQTTEHPEVANELIENKKSKYATSTNTTGFLKSVKVIQEKLLKMRLNQYLRTIDILVMIYHLSVVMQIFSLYH